MRAGGGGATIIDDKTAAVADAKEAARRARGILQLKIYGLAYRETAGAAPRRVELRFVESGVSGGAVVTAAALDAAREAIQRTADALREGRFEARPSSFTCGVCPYAQVCPEAVRG